MIKWIKTGGKNNEEGLEILDTRNKDRFRHKAHKKSRKKKKGRDSTVQYIPHLDKRL